MLFAFANCFFSCSWIIFGTRPREAKTPGDPVSDPRRGISVTPWAGKELRLPLHHSPVPCGGKCPRVRDYRAAGTCLLARVPRPRVHCGGFSLTCWAATPRFTSCPVGQLVPGAALSPVSELRRREGRRFVSVSPCARIAVSQEMQKYHLAQGRHQGETKLTKLRVCAVGSSWPKSLLVRQHRGRGLLASVPPTPQLSARARHTVPPSAGL